MTEHTVASVEELVGMTDLSDIVYYEVFGKRRDGFVQGDATVPDTPQTESQVLQRVDGERLEVRCRTAVETADASYLVDVAAYFRVPQGTKVPDAVSSEFIENVGLMVVYPYLREAVSQMSTKLRAQHLSLSLLKRGTVSLTSTPLESA